MRNFLIATTGLFVGAGLFAALLVALHDTTNVTVKQAAPQVAAMPRMAQGGGGMMASAGAAPATSKLTIRHVLKGCHVWSNGKTTSPTMRLMLKRAGKLSILDQDVDAHQLMQLSGPMKLHLGRPMMTGRGMTVSFTKKGVYRLKTETVETAGMAMDVETTGPDNTLRLVVTVA